MEPEQLKQQLDQIAAMDLEKQPDALEALVEDISASLDEN
jgi:hypothetical protein